MTVEQFIQTWGEGLTAGQRNVMRDHLVRMCTTEGWNDVSMEPDTRPVLGTKSRLPGAEAAPVRQDEGAKDVPFEVEIRDTPPSPPPLLGTGERETVE